MEANKLTKERLLKTIENGGTLSSTRLKHLIIGRSKFDELKEKDMNILYLVYEKDDSGNDIIRFYIGDIPVK